MRPSNKVKWARAVELCGLGAGFEIDTEEDYVLALKRWKDRTVSAREAGDDEAAAELSQAKELFKKRFTALREGKCPDCGEAKSGDAVRCGRCARLERYHKRTLDEESTVKTEAEPMNETDLELATVMVPQRIQATAILTRMLHKLASSGLVGDSFVTDKKIPSIKNGARLLGLEVIARIANPEEKDPKQRRFRVWRSDGLDMHQVNAVIADRQAGRPAPPPKACIPQAKK